MWRGMRASGHDITSPSTDHLTIYSANPSYVARRRRSKVVKLTLTLLIIVASPVAPWGGRSTTH